MMPGAVKITIGAQDFYHQPLSSFCIERGCKVCSWDDIERDGFWIQHGENQEATRFFPRRLPLSIAPYRMIAVRPDVLEWVIECHKYESTLPPSDDPPRHVRSVRRESA